MMQEGEICDQKQQLEELKKWRAELRRFISYSELVFRATDAQVSIERARPGRLSTKERVIDEARKILREKGVMRLRPLTQHLLDQGIAIGGKDAGITVSVTLSRARDVFKNDRAAGWSLRDGEAQP